MLDGKVTGRCMQQHRHQEFIRFVNTVEAAVPAGNLIHAIADNYATHKYRKVRRWLARPSTPGVPFCPTSASWLNAVDGYFATLTKRRLKRGVFRSRQSRRRCRCVRHRVSVSCIMFSAAPCPTAVRPLQSLRSLAAPLRSGLSSYVLATELSDHWQGLSTLPVTCTSGNPRPEGHGHLESNLVPHVWTAPLVQEHRREN